MKYYFISYSHEGGFGNCLATIKHGSFNVKEMMGMIENDGLRQCIILSYKRISRKEYNENTKEKIR